MHQQIAALLASIAVTSLVTLLGWELGTSSYFAVGPEVGTSQLEAPPALKAVASAQGEVLVGAEAIASR